jgi:hypothetical protein
MPKGHNDIAACSTYFAPALDDSPVVQAVTGECLLYSVIVDAGATRPYVQIFDALIADVTAGTTVPKMVVSAVASGNAVFQPAKPVAFKTGIAIISTTAATGSTTAPSDVTIVYG